MSDLYTPTVGMLAALSGAAGATEVDVLRCRLRGLLSASLRPTEVGRACLQREIKRRQGRWPRG